MTGDGRCAALFSGRGGPQCERASGHTGMHEAAGRTVRWGGRYRRSDLNGTPGAEKDARRDNATRVRRPRGQRCARCGHPGELAAGGLCADQVACNERQSPLFPVEEVVDGPRS